MIEVEINIKPVREYKKSLVEIQKELSSDIYDEIEYLKRHLETMSLKEIKDLIDDINEKCDMYIDRFGYHSIVRLWHEYEYPYVNMFISGIRVYPVI